MVFIVSVDIRRGVGMSIRVHRKRGEDLQQCLLSSYKVRLDYIGHCQLFIASRSLASCGEAWFGTVDIKWHAPDTLYT